MQSFVKNQQLPPTVYRSMVVSKFLERCVVELLFDFLYPAGSHVETNLDAENPEIVIRSTGQETRLPLRGKFHMSVSHDENGGYRVRVMGVENFDHLLTTDILLFMRQAARERAAQKAQRVAEKVEKKADDDTKLRAYLLEFVRIEPGMSMSHYERQRCPGKDALGSQDRKERMMRLLLQQGEIVRVRLAKPVKRQTHAVYLRGAAPAN